MNIQLWQQKQRIDSPRLGKRLLSRDQIMVLSEGTIASYQAPLEEGAELRQVVHKWDNGELLVYLVPYNHYKIPPVNWIYLINHVEFDVKNNRYDLPAVWVNDEKKLDIEYGGGDEVFSTMLW